jgi:HlyD family secretion protein
VREGRFVSYEVIIDVDNRTGNLLPGMTASVEFVRSDARAVLRVPIEALYFLPQGYEPEVPPEIIAAFERRMGQQLPSDPQLRRATLNGIEAGMLSRQGLRRIFVFSDGQVTTRNVRVEGEDLTHIGIGEGLEEGEEVIIGHAR